MPICKKCGNEYDDSLNACPNCGEPYTPDIPDETVDVYQELLSSSDTKEFVMPSDLLEEIVPEDMLSDPDTGEPLLHNDNIREQMVREMYAEEPEEPGFIDNLQSSFSSFIGSFRKNISSVKDTISNSLPMNKNSASEKTKDRDEMSVESVTDNALAESISDDIQDLQPSGEDPDLGPEEFSDSHDISPVNNHAEETIDKLQSSFSSFKSSFRKSISSVRATVSNLLPMNKTSSSKEAGYNSEVPSEAITDNDMAESISKDVQDLPSVNEEPVLVPEAISDSQDTASVINPDDEIDEDAQFTEKIEDNILPETENNVEIVNDQASETTDDEALYEEFSDFTSLFDELSDEPSFEVGFMPAIPEEITTETDIRSESLEITEPTKVIYTEQEPEAAIETDMSADEPDLESSEKIDAEEFEETENSFADITPSEDEKTEEPSYEESSVDTILEGLRDTLDNNESTDETEQAAITDSMLNEESSAVTESSDVEEELKDISSNKESRLLRKKGLGKAAVLGLALLAILSVLGVIFFWILPQKKAEQEAIEARENAYLDFLCDTWMSDVFIYADQAHPSREVLTLGKDYTYHCDIWTSSSDREAFDPEIWSITDTNEGTYYLELDTASLRIYYTGEDGEDYVYRRYIRQLDDNVLVLREYYNETLSEYYDVTFSKYTEGIS